MGELLIVRDEMRDVNVAGVSVGKNIFANLVSEDESAQAHKPSACSIPIDEAVVHPEFDDEVDQLLLDVRSIFVVIAPIERMQADAARVN
jgi:hypothetical protein